MSEQTPVHTLEDSFQAVLEAHRRHAAVMTDAARAADAPRSRRALYNAIKTYRKAETAFYHAATGGSPPADDKT